MTEHRSETRRQTVANLIKAGRVRCNLGKGLFPHRTTIQFLVDGRVEVGSGISCERPKGKFETIKTLMNALPLYSDGPRGARSSSFRDDPSQWIET